MQSHSFPIKCAGDRVAEEQAELPEHPCLLHAQHFCCQHSLYANIDKVDDEGASRCMDRLSTHAQSQAGGDRTARQGREEADLRLQGPRKLRGWRSCWRPAQRSDVLKSTDHCRTTLHLSTSDVCTQGTWVGDGLCIAIFLFFFFCTSIPIVKRGKISLCTGLPSFIQNFCMTSL